MTREELLADPYVAAFPELLPFWEATARGVLLLPRCSACNETHWHPRAHCPFCRSDALRWEEASGRGTLHTFTFIRRAEGPLDVLGYVQLDEGLLVLTNIVDVEPARLRIGMPVRVTFQPTPQGRSAPVFVPDGGDAGQDR